MDYIVTIKLPKNPDHDPRNKITGECPVSTYCTDVTGEHHSTIVYAASEEDARRYCAAKGWQHITRLEAF
jgi:hypothetical protein